MEKITIEAIDALNQRFVLVNFNSKIKKDEHDNLIFTEVFKNDIYFSVGNADPKDIFTDTNYLNKVTIYLFDPIKIK